MSDTEKIIWTSVLTLAGGVVLFVLSELLKILVITPIHKLREQIQEALAKLDFHCNMLTNYFSSEPSETEKLTIRKIKKDLRFSATQLKSKYSVIPCKKLFARIGLIPSAENINIAYHGLIYLHNSILYEGQRSYVVNEIELNNNEIERIKAALSGLKVPDHISPIETR